MKRDVNQFCNLIGLQKSCRSGTKAESALLALVGVAPPDYAVCWPRDRLCICHSVANARQQKMILTVYCKHEDYFLHQDIDHQCPLHNEENLVLDKSKMIMYLRCNMRAKQSNYYRSMQKVPFI